MKKISVSIECEVCKNANHSWHMVCLECYNKIKEELQELKLKDVKCE